MKWQELIKRLTTAEEPLILAGSMSYVYEPQDREEATGAETQGNRRELGWHHTKKIHDITEKDTEETISITSYPA